MTSRLDALMERAPKWLGGALVVASALLALGGAGLLMLAVVHGDYAWVVWSLPALAAALGLWHAGDRA